MRALQAGFTHLLMQALHSFYPNQMNLQNPDLQTVMQQARAKVNVQVVDLIEQLMKKTQVVL
ncbi:hypothetical protein [Sneathiella glossodoripedis]|uniref:hypothetical protein n=1 Tax=Sneathiella glossodoripedis TaxID=418853 RepID=UPI00047132D2|nr:hypothetical protein [Sneathiella glossodoripedis]